MPLARNFVLLPLPDRLALTDLMRWRPFNCLQINGDSNVRRRSVSPILQWQNYEGPSAGQSFFAQNPLTYNCRQERLHKLKAGDRLWLVSRNPRDQQHYFVGVLHILDTVRNASENAIGKAFGPFGVVADAGRSRDFGLSFPADGLLRAFSFESGKSVRTGAYLGQALQAIRFLSAQDEQVLERLESRKQTGEVDALDTPFALWTKCDVVFAEYFLANWRGKQEPLAFLLYDSPPVLPSGAPVFIHSDKSLRIVASYIQGEYVSGYRLCVDEAERLAERERIWQTYRASTINPPAKPDFDAFWDGQHGVRALFLMHNLVEIPTPLPFREYGRALEWGYPMGVGYRYLSLSQAFLLIRACRFPESASDVWLNSLLERTDACA